MIVFISIFLLGCLWFLYVLNHEPRSLFLGASFVAMLLGTALLVISIGFKYSRFIAEHQLLFYLLLLLTALLVICGIMLPFVLILFFIYNGIKVLSAEGFKLHNLLSLCFGVLCIAYLFIWPIFGHLSDKNIWKYTYGYLGTLAIYFILVMIMYTITLSLNLVHFRTPKLDYIVVLGAGLNGREVTPLLAARIDRAIKVYRKRPATKLIMSGGKGPDEVISEAEAMQNYALKQGVPKKDVILEDRSTTTYENITFSHKLMQQNAKFGIATNSFHVYRALVIAKKAGYKCVGFGAKTRWYFTLNAFIREFIAYLKISYKLQLSVVIGLGAIYMIFAFLKI